MPATNPRLSVVLPRSTMTVIRRLAAIEGRSRSAIVRDFLVEAEPVMARVAGLLEVASKHKDGWPKELVRHLEDQQEAIEAYSLGQMDAMAEMVHDYRRMVPRKGRD